MATWWQGVWTHPDGRRTTSPPPPVPGMCTAPEGTGAKPNTPHRFPPQVHQQLQQDPSKVKFDDYQDMAQKIWNALCLTDAWTRIIEMDRAEAPARKEPSYYGAFPRRPNDGATNATGAYRDCGNWQYCFFVLILERAMLMLRPTKPRLENIRLLTNKQKFWERGGDIIEAVIGALLKKKDTSPDHVWQTEPWNLSFTSQGPEEAAVIRLIAAYNAVEPWMLRLSETTDMDLAICELWEHISNPLTEIDMWHGKDDWWNRARSKAGWTKKKERDDRRAAARARGGKGKGVKGKDKHNASASSSSCGHGKGTAPEGAGSQWVRSAAATVPSKGGKGDGGSGDWATRGQPKGGDYVIYSDSSHSTKGGDWGELDDPNFHPRLVSPQRWADQADSEPDWG